MICDPIWCIGKACSSHPFTPKLCSRNDFYPRLYLISEQYCQVPLKTASLDDLIERFAELSRADPHLGVNPGAPSGDDPSLTLEQERYQLGVKVLDMDHAPLSQEYLKRGCPHSIRGSVWAQVSSFMKCEEDALTEDLDTLDLTRVKLFHESLFCLLRYYINITL